MTNQNVSKIGTRIKARQDVAAAVRAHMAVRDIKDTELARELGWTQSYVSRRTNAATAFSTDDLGDIADHFDITLSEVVQMPTKRPGGGYTFTGGGLRKGHLKLVGLPEVDSNHQPAGSLLQLVPSVADRRGRPEQSTPTRPAEVLPFPTRTRTADAS